MKRKYTIYCLSGPNKKDIFYVGYTKLTLTQRLKNHVNSNDGNNRARVNKVEKYNGCMEIHELYSFVATKKQALEKELEWMVILVSKGYELVNVTGIRGYINKKRVGTSPIGQEIIEKHSKPKK